MDVVGLSAAEYDAVAQAAAIADVFCKVVKKRKKFSTPTSTSAPIIPTTCVDSMSEEAVQNLLRAAMAANATAYGVAAAKEWGDGFQFPLIAKEQDAQLFAECNNNFRTFCLRRRALHAAERLSEERVVRELANVALSSTKDYKRLLRIARGVVICCPPDFVPCSERPEMRKRYVEEVSHAVNKLLFAQWEKGTVVLLPTELAATISGINWSFQHWTTKQGKMCGRSLCDVANALDGFIPLNGLGTDGKQHLRNVLEKMWGKIKHPTVSDLALMVWKACSTHGPENLVLWKMDLAGAFNLMDFDPDSARLLAFELTDSMTAIHNTGMFGWAGTPYVFQVITRVLQDILRPVLRGLHMFYVDDLMAVSPRCDLQNDMDNAALHIRALLGPTAVAVDKSLSGRAMDFIGWHFDLDTMSVSIAHKNMLKCIYVFFCFDLTTPISLNAVERLGSLAARYSTLCRPMRPYTVALFQCISGYQGNRKALRPLSRLAQTDVAFWRAFLCLLNFDAASYARPIESFLPRKASVLIEYDASLTGLGAGVSVLNPVTKRFELLVYASLALPFTVTKDSSFQNSNEFIAILLGLLLVYFSSVPSGFAYNLVGDNTSSLAWCRAGKAASTLARRASIGMSLVLVEMDAFIAETKHKKGELNVVYDGLSRGKTGTEVGLCDQLQFRLPNSHPIVQYVILCNPNAPLSSPAEHNALSVALLSILGAHERV
jgi:hypothetical protein